MCSALVCPALNSAPWVGHDCGPASRLCFFCNSDTSKGLLNINLGKGVTRVTLSTQNALCPLQFAFLCFLHAHFTSLCAISEKTYQCSAKESEYTLVALVFQTNMKVHQKEIFLWALCYLPTLSYQFYVR